MLSDRVAFLLAYGSAVAGRATSGLRAGLMGRMGAEDSVPGTVVVADLDADGLMDAMETEGLMVDIEVEGLVGDRDAVDCAEAGRSGKVPAAIAARFCAAIASLTLGFGGAPGLFRGNVALRPLESPADFEDFFGEFGFPGSFSSKSLCFSSRVDMILGPSQTNY